MNHYFSRLFTTTLLFIPLSAADAAPAAKPTPTKKVAAAAKAATQLAHTVDSIAIPAFPGVPEEFFFSGTQKDLLSVFQSLLGGAKVTDPKASPNMSGATRLFTDSELVDMVSQIHVLNARSLAFKGKSDEVRKEALKGALPANADPNAMDALEDKRMAEAQKFYADLFIKGGGKPQLTLQNNQTSIAVYVFQSSDSWALLTRGPSRVIVVRADGYPKLGIIGRLFRQASSG